MFRQASYMQLKVLFLFKVSDEGDNDGLLGEQGDSFELHGQTCQVWRICANSVARLAEMSDNV